jgi:hypothetical protein
MYGVKGMERRGSLSSTVKDYNRAAGFAGHGQKRQGRSPFMHPAEAARHELEIKHCEKVCRIKRGFY